MLYNEGAFQCPNLEKIGCDECSECRGTGIIKMGFYSWYIVEKLEKIGYKLCWYKWNPLFKEKCND